VHHAALPYSEIGAFMHDLQSVEGFPARALEFLILTCSRTSEVTRASWPEFDLANNVWNIPAERMKAGRPHRVALSKRVIVLLQSLPREAEWVFPGSQKGKPIHSAAMDMALPRVDVTVHGFRSTFRDWAAEQTNFPRDVAEMALAHTVGDKTEAAYRRGDLFDKRRQLAEAWAQYCASPRVNFADVISINQKVKT
jgi:integrase